MSGAGIAFASLVAKRGGRAAVADGDDNSASASYDNAYQSLHGRQVLIRRRLLARTEQEHICRISLLTTKTDGQWEATSETTCDSSCCQRYKQGPKVPSER